MTAGKGINAMPPETIAVTGKGGAGKTTFTAIAAKLLIAQGYRPLIIDADPPVSLAIALGMGSVATIGDYRKRLIENPEERRKIGERHMRDVLIEEALVEQPDYSFFAIGRAEGPGCYCGINELLKHGIESLAERYELTLVDCEAGIEQINRRVLGSINTLLIVSDPTVKGLQTAAHLKKIATDYGVEGSFRIRLILNRVENGVEELLEKSKELGLELAGMIPMDRKVIEFDRTGRSIWELPDDAPSLLAVGEILGRLGFRDATMAESSAEKAGRQADG
jgi:CO dehydrogenase maturation factor